MRRSRLALLVSAALLSFPALEAQAEGLTVNAGNIISVVLSQNVSTATNRVGDKIQAQCAGGDCGGFPRGTKFFAVLSQVSPKTKKSSGILEGMFVTAVLPDGRKIPIQAQPQAGSEIEGSTEVKKGNQKKTTAAGAAAGAVVSGGAGGAVIGGFLGHALGRHKKTTTSDLAFNAGTPFQIRMLETVTVPAEPNKR
jgi:hypothetical protein